MTTWIRQCRSRLPWQPHSCRHNSPCHPKIHSQHGSHSSPQLTPLSKTFNDLPLDWHKIQTPYDNLSCTTRQSLHLLQPHLIPVCPHSISSHSDLWEFPRLPSSSHLQGHFLTYFFIKYLLSVRSALDTGDTAVNKRLSPALRKFSFWWRETDSKQINIDIYAARSW